MANALLKNPRLLAITIGLILVTGFATLSRTVRQEDPTITNGVAVIVTPYPGATAERVEALVTEKIEDELRELSEIDVLSSVSRSGVSVVTVEIDEDVQGAAVEPVFAKIRDALDDARTRFPPGVPAPVFDDERFGSYTLTLGLRWTADGPPRRGILRRYAEELQSRLRELDGTDSVKLFGAPPEEIAVRVDPHALAAAGLSATQVAVALRRADVKVAAGVVRSARSDLLVEVGGELDSLQRIREVPITAASGAVLRVGDIAELERRVQSPPRDLARVAGQPAVVIAAQLAEGQRFDLWREDAEAVRAAFEAELPGGIALHTVFEQARYTQARLDALVSNLLSGLLLVVLVLLLTLGWRSALVVSLTLPLVSLSALAVLFFLGVPIHQMSVTGLIVALGLLVDNAIVVTDAIRSRRLKGTPAATAVRDALRHLWSPLLSSTLTTVLAFMPILLLTGRVGEFVFAIGLSVIVALLSSYLLAMTVVPAAAALLVRPDASGRRGLRGLWTRGIELRTLGRLFNASVGLSLRFPRSSLLLASLPPALGVIWALELPQQFFPPADRDHFHIELRLSEQASIEETTRATEAVDAVLATHPEVRESHWFIGRSAPPFYYNLKQEQDGTPSYAQAMVQLDSVQSAMRLMPALQDELDDALPGAQILVRELLQGPPVDAPVELRIYGANVEKLREIGEALRERLSRVPQITHALATLSAGSAKLRVDADEDALGLLGLRLVDLAAQLDARLEGLPAGRLLERGEELPLRVRAHGEARSTVDALRSATLNLPAATAGQAPFPAVPLSSVAALSLQPLAGGIPHRNGQRVNIVRGFTDAGVYPEAATRALEAILAADPVPVPPGYRIEVGGDAEKRAKAMGNLFAFVPVLVLLMLAIVALSLGSFRLSGLVFVVAIQSMGLGLLSLALFGWPLGFQAMIGLIGLVGVAINAAIVISSALRASPGALAGEAAQIQDIVVGETSRHIISTTITTFGGFLPLILAGGGFWPPFATGIAGGVLLSSLLSFYFVPAAFLLMTRRRRFAAPSESPSPSRPALATGTVLALLVFAGGDALAQPAWDLDARLRSPGAVLSAPEIARRAVERSPAVQRALARTEAAGARRDVAWAGLLPRVSLDARYTRLGGVDNDALVRSDVDFDAARQAAAQIEDPNARALWEAQLDSQEALSRTRIDIPKNQFFFGASVAYPASQLFFEILPGLRARKAGERARQWESEVVRHGVSLRAVEVYFDHARARGAQMVAARSIDRAQSQLSQAAARLEAELGDRVDLLRFRARLAQAQRQAAEQRAAVTSSAHALRTLLDLQGSGPLAIAEALTQPPSRPALPELESSIEKAWDQRPELRAVRALRRSQSLAADAAGGAFWPTFTLAAGVDAARPNPRFVPPGDRFRASWTASGLLSWSPDGAFAANRRERAARAEARAIAAQYEALRDQVRIEVVRAHSLYTAGRVALDAAGAQVRAAEEAYAARQEAFGLGLADSTQLIDAELDAQQAWLALIDAGAALRVSGYRLDRAVGTARW